MDAAFQEFLSARHAVEEWPDPTPGMIDGPDPTSLVMEGWSLVQRRSVRIPEARSAWLGLWERNDSGGTVLVRIDLTDTTGQQAARSRLLELLGEFQSPLVQRYYQAPVGDIAFGPPDETMIVFTRANVVVALRNAERDVVPVIGVAIGIDEQLRAGLEPGSPL